MKYRKRPVVIEAQKWDGTDEGYRNIITNFASLEKEGTALPISFTFREFIVIHTLEGVMQTNPGDYIIRGVKGEYYPCKPDIFEATYEKVS